MKTGDLIESSIWVTGDEPKALLDRYKQDVTEAISYLCQENGMTYGDVTFIEKHPMDDIPEVPDHISGSRVRLLVGEAYVTGVVVETTEGSFVNNLDHKDLMKLRTIIRRYGTRSNADCDAIIEQIGPEAAIDTLRSLH